MHFYNINSSLEFWDSNEGFWNQLYITQIDNVALLFTSESNKQKAQALVHNTNLGGQLILYTRPIGQSDDYLDP